MNTSPSYIYVYKKNVVVTIVANGNKINKPIATYLVSVYP